MELLVFDLDGTLLNGDSRISAGTESTLSQLAERGVAYTVATGRSLHASRRLLEGQGFHLPHVYKNGVMVWDPSTGHYSHQNCLTLDEVNHVMTAMIDAGVAPFVSTVEPQQQHGIYHGPMTKGVEKTLAEYYTKTEDLVVRPLSELPAESEIVSISGIAGVEAIGRVQAVITPEPHLMAYSGVAWEGDDWRWIDIHHTDATKGAAVSALKAELGFGRVVCFGDAGNDLSMFATADECYAPENADDSVKAAATAVIGHHDEDGVAEFLRERFSLD